MTSPTRDVFQLELEKRGVVQAVTNEVTGGVGISAAGVPIYGRNALQSVRGGLLDKASWSSHHLLFATADQAALGNLYWPWVVRADERIANPLGKYYLFYSTDHTTGGIAMMYADSITGPWTPYGKVFGDTESAEEGETPSVIWDAAISKYRMFYHCNGAKYNSGASSAIGVQSTLSATSDDLLTWTKDQSFVIDVPATAQVRGDGHTGYFLPFETNGGVFAHSLSAGTDSSDVVLWRMGRTVAEWKTDWRSLGYGFECTAGIATYKRLERNHSFVVESGGAKYLICLASDGASGATAKNARLVAARISDNLKSVVGQPAIIWTPDEAWETSDIRSITPFVEAGVLYVFYSIAKTHVGVFAHVL